MKRGVILAGGTGSRLAPLTNITNKHLLPVYDRPMIYYPIQSLLQCRIKEILIVTGGSSSSEIMRLLGSGHSFGCHFEYAYQDTNGGIADALRLAYAFADHDKIMVMLGDNIFMESIEFFMNQFEFTWGTQVLLTKVPDPKNYGVPILENDKITKIVEKPEQPVCDLAVTGCYFYDFSVFDVIETLKPSKRGELEISDVNNEYARQNMLQHAVYDGIWIDCGASHDHLLDAGLKIRNHKQGKQ